MVPNCFLLAMHKKHTKWYRKLEQTHPTPPQKHMICHDMSILRYKENLGRWQFYWWHRLAILAPSSMVALRKRSAKTLAFKSRKKWKYCRATESLDLVQFPLKLMTLMTNWCSAGAVSWPKIVSLLLEFFQGSWAKNRPHWSTPSSSMASFRNSNQNCLVTTLLLCTWTSRCPPTWQERRRVAVNRKPVPTSHGKAEGGNALVGCDEICSKAPPLRRWEISQSQAVRGFIPCRTTKSMKKTATNYYTPSNNCFTFFLPSIWCLLLVILYILCTCVCIYIYMFLE